MAQTSPNLYGKLFMVKKGRPSLCSGLDNLKAIYGIIYVAVLVFFMFVDSFYYAQKYGQGNMPAKFSPTKTLFGGSSQNTLWYFYRLMDPSQC